MEYACRRGHFSAVFPFRASQVTVTDPSLGRWQSDYLQHHAIVEGGGPHDAHIDVHDHLHALLGLMWWRGITVEEFYLGVRLSEAVAAYHYFFLDEMLDPRCPMHRFPDFPKIIKIHACDDCIRPSFHFDRLSPKEQREAERRAAQYADAGRRFLVWEVKQIAEHAQNGCGFVERNPVNHSTTVEDSLRYALSKHSLLSSRYMQGYLDLLEADQHFQSLEDYLHNARRVLDVVMGTVSLPPPSDLRPRRALFLCQDLALRVGMLLALSEKGPHRLNRQSARQLSTALERIGRTGQTCRRLLSEEKRTTQEALADVIDSFEHVWRVVKENGFRNPYQSLLRTGYNLVTVMGPGTVNRTSRSGRNRSVVCTTQQSEICAELVRQHFPHTWRFAGLLSCRSMLTHGFVASKAYWSATEQSEIDGRAPRYDHFLQRFLRFLRARNGDRWAPILAELTRIEYEFLRYAVRVTPGVDLLSQLKIAGKGTSPESYRLSPLLGKLRAGVSLSAISRAVRTRRLREDIVRDRLYLFISRDQKARIVEADLKFKTMARFLRRPRSIQSTKRFMEQSVGRGADDQLAMFVDLGVLECPSGRVSSTER